MTKICAIFIFRLLCSFNDLADLGGYIVQGNLLAFFHPCFIYNFDGTVCVYVQDV